MPLVPGKLYRIRHDICSSYPQKPLKENDILLFLKSRRVASLNGETICYFQVFLDPDGEKINFRSIFNVFPLFLNTVE